MNDSNNRQEPVENSKKRVEKNNPGKTSKHDKKLVDILLFGTQGAGKTQLLYSLQRKDYNKPIESNIETQKVRKGDFWLHGLSRYTVREIGGKNLYLRDTVSLKSHFKESSRLLFVFDGNKLINEFTHYQEGGVISMLLRCYVMPALQEINEGVDDKLKREIIFIATHEDRYSGTSMKKDIILSLIKANEEYRKEANGIRFTFGNNLRGNLFCVDATDPVKVIDLFEQIYK